MFFLATKKPVAWNTLEPPVKGMARYVQVQMQEWVGDNGVKTPGNH